MFVGGGRLARPGERLTIFAHEIRVDEKWKESKERKEQEKKEKDRRNLNERKEITIIRIFNHVGNFDMKIDHATLTKG